MAYCEVTGTAFAARIEYRVEQDTVQNRSVVHITGLALRALSGGTIGSCWVTGGVTVNGQQAAQLLLTNTESCGVYLSEAYFAGGEGSWSGFRSADVTVEHRPDGSGEIRFGVNLSLRLTTGTVLEPGISTQAMVLLPRIPRASELAASPVTLGQEMVIRLVRQSVQFRDTVSWRCGSRSGTIAVQSGNTEFRWVPPVELAEQEPNRAIVPVTIVVTSFSGTTEVGTGTVTVFCPIPESMVPTLSVMVSDELGYPQQHGGYIQSQSRVRVHTQASGAYGSLIARIDVTCGGMTGSGETAIFVPEYSGRVAVSVTVTDTRGRTAVWKSAIEVLPYEKPTAVIRESYRCDSAGNSQPDGGYLKLVFDAAVTQVQNGTAVYRAVRQVHGGESRSEVLLTDYSGLFRVTGGSVVLPAGTDSGYDCTVIVTDSFQVVQSLPVMVPVAFVLLDLSRGTRAVGIGMRAKNAGKLTIGLDTDMEEHRIGNLAEPVSAADAATKSYVDGQLAALRQALGLG